jgi:hypothetical protein
MKRFLSLNVNGQNITAPNLIEEYLYSSEFYWLCDAEIESAKLTIKDNILSWDSGIFYYGEWKWGVFRSGEFRSGNWLGGIFLDGTFKGNWFNGVFKKGIFKGVDISGKLQLDNKLVS